ncbi:MAG: radical SAM protein [Candidatus Ozemobacteraceae bacterium]
MKNSEVHYEFQIEIETQCFLNCIHCSSVNLRHVREIQYSPSSISPFLSIFRGRKTVVFTGGEPLANFGLPEIASVLKESVENVSFGIFSSGITFDNGKLISVSASEARRLKNSGIRFAYLSFYHQSPEYHDLITGVPTSFNLTHKTLQSFLTEDIDVKVHLVLNRFNIDDLDKIINHFFSLGILEVRLLRLARHGNAEIYWDKIGIPNKKVNSAVIDILERFEKGPGIVSISGFPQVMPCRPWAGARGCQAGSRLMFVTHEGEVFPCACVRNRKDLEIGSLSDLSKIREYIENNSFEYRDKCLNAI